MSETICRIGEFKKNLERILEETMEHDELEKFLQKYKIKLERERLELLTSSADIRSRFSAKVLLLLI